MGEGSRGWRWHPKGTSASPERLLLYEPGNRGDLLKATWLAAIAAALDGERGRPILDPCAGAPSYPLTAAAKELRDRAPEPLRSLLVSAAGEDRWPSSGLLLHRAREERGAPGPLRVFDRDPARLAAWGDIPGAEILAGESGEALLGPLAELPASELPALLLVDPYDLFHRFGPWLRPLARLIPAVPALLYLYNKSPRGEGHLDQYRRLRASLAALGDPPPLVGRVASDAREPRALHEVWLFAGEELRRALREPLAAATEELLARVPGEAGFPSFEGG